MVSQVVSISPGHRSGCVQAAHAAGYITCALHGFHGRRLSADKNVNQLE